MSIHIFTDIDGVLTSCHKTYYEIGHKIEKIKHFSDIDIFTLSRWNDIITLITRDGNVSKKWAMEHSIPIIIADKSKDKWDIISTKNKAEYIVCIGNTMDEYYMLLNADIAYYPKDASTSLKNALKKSGAIELPLRGGDGILDWVVCELIRLGKLENRYAQ